MTLGPGKWVESRRVKAVATILVGAGLIALALSLPWSAGGTSGPAIHTHNRTLSINVNWSATSQGGPGYDFGADSVTSTYNAFGSSVNSSLTLMAEGGEEPNTPGGFTGGFEVNVYGSLVPSMGESSIRFVLVESANSTIPSALGNWPGGGNPRNVSSVESAWVAQSGSDYTGGPGSISLQLDLENQTNASLSDLVPSYHFSFSLEPRWISGPLQDGQTTYSLFAILQGLSQPVYCAMTFVITQTLR